MKPLELIQADISDCLQSFADLARERAAVEEFRASIYEKYRNVPRDQEHEWVDALMEELQSTSLSYDIIHEKAHELAVRFKRLHLEMELSLRDKA